MQGLYDPARHEPLTSTAWDEAAAHQAIVRIAASAEAEFDAAQGNWPLHPLDEPTPPGVRQVDLYFGSLGAIWALRDLAAQGAITLHTDFLPAIEAGPEQLRSSMADYLHGSASFLCGESGALLLQWMATRRAEVGNRLFDVVKGNLHNGAREPLWGNPGTLLAAIHMSEATGEVRWIFLVQQGIEVLLSEMIVDPETGSWIWEQDLYQRRTRHLGAGHGFAGNVFAALRGANNIDELTRTTFEERALETLSLTALRAEHQGVLGLSWHPMVDAKRVAGRLPLVQDCHGSPGIICRLASMPRSAAWNELLRGAGELTWFAGPLSKGPSLCHGTAGSAMACLKLWRRFGEAQWLARARHFAMHAIEQVEAARAKHGQGRHTLWTGDLGVACTLWNCIRCDDRFPTLDHF